MVRLMLTLCLVSGILTTTGCTSLPNGADLGTKQAKRGPKKLLEWTGFKDETDDEDNESEKEKTNSKEEAKQNGDKKENDKPESTSKKKGENKKDKEGDVATEEKDEIKTDRPDFTEASTTVGKDRVQLESGYTYIRDRSKGSRLSAHSFPEALLRVGLFAEWFELRFGQNFARERTTLLDGSRETIRGAEDLYLGVKFALTEQQKLFPEMALVFQMTVPTGSRDLSSREVLPGLNWLYGWDIVEDRLALGGSTQLNRVRGAMFYPMFDELGQSAEPLVEKHSYTEFAQSITVNYSLTKQLGFYTEWFAFFPHSSLDPDVGSEHYINGGFTYKFTPNTQLDLRIGFGLNERANDMFAGIGFSFRY